MKKSILIITLLISTISFSQNIFEDNVDKAAHFGIGAGVGVATDIIYDNIFKGDGKSEKVHKRNKTIAVLASSLLVGLAKEIYDNNTHGNFDVKDLGATFIGGVAITITF